MNPVGFSYLPYLHKLLQKMFQVDDFKTTVDSHDEIHRWTQKWEYRIKDGIRPCAPRRRELWSRVEVRRELGEVVIHPLDKQPKCYVDEMTEHLYVEDSKDLE